MKRLRLGISGWRLQTKLLAMHLALLAVPLGVSGAIAIRWAAASMQARNQLVLDQAVRQAQVSIATIAGEVERLGDSLISSPEIQRVLTRARPPAWEQAAEYQELLRILHGRHRHESVAAVRLYVPDDRMYSRDGIDFLPRSTLAGLGRTRSSWVVPAAGPGPPDGPMTYIAVIRSLQDLSETIGYAEITLTDAGVARILQDLLVTSPAGLSAAAVIDSASGRPLAAVGSGRAHLAALLAGLAPMPADAASSHLIAEWQGHRTTVLRREILRQQWALISAFPSDAGFGQVRRFAIAIGSVFAASGALGTLAALLVSRRIARGVSRLSRRMRTIRDGRHARVPLQGSPADRRDEIGQLEESFDFMLDEINELIRDNNATHARMRDTELRLLQAQINPHFLYNVLDSINWMAIRHSARDIYEMVQHLGKFYRLGLSGGQDVVTLAQELEYTRTYVAIQSLRFRSTVVVRYDIDPAVERTPVPKLTVQPLVENAFVHGILAGPEQRGSIEIRARCRGDVVHVEVEDDGPGPRSADPLAREPAAAARPGYGMRNVDERIKLHFGQRYGVQIERRGALTVAGLVLPALPPDPRRVEA
jgi:two-component system sensor histidine kinase YesM